MPLSDLQRRCATIILQLPSVAGFALAGGRLCSSTRSPIAARTTSIVSVRPWRLSTLSRLRRSPRSRDMLRLVAAKDRGFSPEVLADAFRVLPTYDRVDEFPSLSDDAHARLLATFSAWEADLGSGAAGS